MSEQDKILSEVTSKEYEYGFVTDIETETIQRGLSEDVVRLMAGGVSRIMLTDCAIATSGVAGPGGGTPEKPVGTVWIGIATPKGSFAVLKNCGTDRGQIVQRATAYAIQLLQNNFDFNNL